jgi:tetratricopeptide (TPR) repeat protein
MEGKGQESIFSMVDELTKWTKTSLMLSDEQVAVDLDLKIGDVTTSVPAAFKFYLEGRNYHAKAKNKQSIECMEKAIVLDPDFAMAYRSMGHSLGNMGKNEEKMKYLQKALELSNRLTEREKLLIQGDYSLGTFSEDSFEEAIDSYEKLVSLYPDSDEAISAYHNLALLYQKIEDWDDAIKNYEASIKAGTDFLRTYSQLAAAYMANGELDEAQKVIKSGIDRFPDEPSLYWHMAWLNIFQGDIEHGLTEADKAIAIDPTYSKAIFHHVLWDFDKAEEEYKKWFERVSRDTHVYARAQLEYLYRTLGKFKEAINQIQLAIDLGKDLGWSIEGGLFNQYYWLAYDYLSMGRHEEALNTLDEIGPIEPLETELKMYILELKGWICLDMGNLNEAENTAEEIKRLIDGSLSKKRIRHYHFLRGLIQLEGYDFSGAVESFENVLSLLPRPQGWINDDPLYRYYLAMAYHDSGDLQKARDELERLVAFVPGRITFGDLYAQSYYRLGKVYEQLRDSEKAVENYEKFLTLWKDADPGIAKVEDAKERLAGLKSQ